MIGAILAGGLGTRLQSVVSDRPKVLATVLGKPFLAYLLDQLVDAGIGRIVLMTGYRSEQVEAAFGRSYRGASLDYSVETSPLGTAGALRLALPKLSVGGSGLKRDDGVLVLNGDSYCAADLVPFHAFHRERNPAASLVLTRVTDTSRFGTVEIDEDERVQQFIEKQGIAVPGWINAGVYLLDPALIAEIPAERAVSLEREMFPAWLKSRTVCGFRSEGAFLDIGTPESYRAAADFLAGRGY